MAHLHFIHPWPPPGHEAEWDNPAVAMNRIFITPGMTVFFGLMSGVLYAFRRERSPKPASTRGQLDF